MSDINVNDVGERLATLEQQGRDQVRRIESYHASIQNYERARKEDKDEMKDHFADKMEIMLGKIKEHINNVNAKAREDFDDKHEKIKEKHDEIEGKADEALQQTRFVKWAGYGFASFVALIGWDNFVQTVKRLFT